LRGDRIAAMGVLALRRRLPEMMRSAPVAFILLLSPSWLMAQGSDLLVGFSPTAVHKAPSTASPVIGQATPGMTLEVTRDVGDWLKVSWREAPDSVGYVRKSAGYMRARQQGSDATPAAVGRREPGTTLTSAAASDAGHAEHAEIRTGRTGPSAAQSGYVTAPTHLVGVGGHLGGAQFGGGVSARVWSRRQLGVQLDVSRYALANTAFDGRMTSTQVGPKVLYAFRDRVSDYTWLRPYVGTGAQLSRSTLSSGVLGASASASASRLGANVFGGAELTFSSAPRFGLSTDVGYHWIEAPFAGYALDGIALTVGGHWYLR
jgi:hypothetical protein